MRAFSVTTLFRLGELAPVQRRSLSLIYASSLALMMGISFILPALPAEATKALKSLKKGSPLFRIMHAAIDDAKMCLFGAKHNHAKPQGDFDHARAIAKAVFSKAFAQQCLKIPHQSLRYSSALPPMFLGSMTKYAGALSSGNLSL